VEKIVPKFGLFLYTLFKKPAKNEPSPAGQKFAQTIGAVQQVQMAKSHEVKQLLKL
jgi:hypothetical protein